MMRSFIGNATCTCGARFHVQSTAGECESTAWARVGAVWSRWSGVRCIPCAGAGLADPVPVRFDGNRVFVA